MANNYKSFFLYKKKCEDGLNFFNREIADCSSETGRTKNDMPFMTALALKFVDYEIYDSAWFPGNPGKVTPAMVS